jgi:hypothetical protein
MIVNMFQPSCCVKRGASDRTTSPFAIGLVATMPMPLPVMGLIMNFGLSNTEVLVDVSARF